MKIFQIHYCTVVTVKVQRGFFRKSKKVKNLFFPSVSDPHQFLCRSGSDPDPGYQKCPYGSGSGFKGTGKH